MRILGARPATGSEEARAAGSPAAATKLPGPISARSALVPRLLASPWLPLTLLFGAAAAVAGTRPSIGGLDTPALAAAWEILRNGEWLGLPAAGAADAVPPLLPSVIALLWEGFGIGLAGPWLLILLAIGVALVLTRALAHRLWPQRTDAGPLASWVFAGSAGILLLGPAITPQAIGLAESSLGLLGLALAGAGRRAGWGLYAGALALLALTAGPMACVVLLAPAVAGPLWAGTDQRPSWIGWYLALAIATACAALPPLWIGGGALQATLPRGAADEGGSRLLLLLAVPLFFYPWLFWPRFWRSARRQSNLAADPGVRVCAIAIFAGIAACLATGAGLLDLLFIAPAGAALIARLLAGRLPGRADFHAGIPALPLAAVGAVPIAVNTVPWAQLAERARQLFGTEIPIWVADLGVGGSMLLLGGTFLLIQGTPRLMISRVAHLALLPAVLALTLAWEMSGSVGRAFDLTPMAARLAELESRGAPIAFYGIDPSNYAFSGRLEQPLKLLADRDAALAWAQENPQGTILAPFEGSVLHLPRQPSYAAPQGARWVALWPAKTVAESGAGLLEPPR